MLGQAKAMLAGAGVKGAGRDFAGGVSDALRGNGEASPSPRGSRSSSPERISPASSTNFDGRASSRYSQLGSPGKKAEEALKGSIGGGTDGYPRIQTDKHRHSLEKRMEIYLKGIDAEKEMNQQILSMLQALKTVSVAARL
jgi:hypothetical protein